MTPHKIDQKLIKARQRLAELARSDDPKDELQLLVELALLEELVDEAPEGKRAKIRALVEKVSAALNMRMTANILRQCLIEAISIVERDAAVRIVPWIKSRQTCPHR